MKFVKASAEDGVKELSRQINSRLNDGKKVLWLVPGGSNIKHVVKIMQDVPDDKSYGLIVMLSDERYGEVGHHDSNESQLNRAGFDIKGGHFITALDNSLSPDQIALRYAKLFVEGRQEADWLVAMLGIGQDGHTAGILPETMAANASEYVIVYQAVDFHRITFTFPALQQCDAIYAFAYGENKKPALEKLEKQNLPVSQQPAQIIKHIPESYIYNDQVG